MLEFLQGLSERSLYLRFHGIRPVDHALAASMVEPDWDERGALAGWLGDRVVGLANYVRLRDPSTAEAAFIVADEEQGRGIGMRLLEQLASRAAEAGISRFVAEVMAENQAMLGVFTGAGFDVVRELERRRGRGSLRDCPDGDVPGAGRGTRPRRRRRLAAAVLRAGERGRDRRVAPARLDRRRALSQRARGRLRGRRLPGQPRRRSRRRRARATARSRRFRTRSNSR